MGDRIPKHSPNDSYPTPTSTLQESTERILASHVPINTPETGYELKKSIHIPFIARAMLQGLPSKYISQDASQPWLMFGSLRALASCRLDLTRVTNKGRLDPPHMFRELISPDGGNRAIDTVLACQHPDGGFGGGPAQSAHLLPTYAAVCALAIAGRPGPGGGWDEIDRYVAYINFISVHHQI